MGQASELKAKLVDAIEQWSNNNCESPEWVSLDIYVGEHLSELMADAAWAVLMGVKDIQDYLKVDGQLKE